MRQIDKWSKEETRPLPVKPQEKNGRDEERENMRQAINRMKDE